ncbi:hypothetical protein BESB_025940 [Besnoitia besnoiti]|uniref:Uncharacterized protein n=1 Tax=Besnoitia besnoiti TaxID=94643 RepID=A0A2A9M8A9_BESBE|nr:uncharacterized protein BESB_025940 [Besnoitia besnoiti]PFH31620.1 hypothetical protein BESB_025940 [Besnoitia besnoiti]
MPTGSVAEPRATASGGTTIVGPSKARSKRHRRPRDQRGKPIITQWGPPVQSPVSSARNDGVPSSDSECSENSQCALNVSVFTHESGKNGSAGSKKDETACAGIQHDIADSEIWYSKNKQHAQVVSANAQTGTFAGKADAEMLSTGHQLSSRLPPTSYLRGIKTPGALSPRLSPDFRSLPSSPSASSTYSLVDGFDLPPEEERRSRHRPPLAEEKTDSDVHETHNTRNSSPRKTNIKAASTDDNSGPLLSMTTSVGSCGISAVRSDDGSMDSCAKAGEALTKKSIVSGRSRSPVTCRGTRTLLERQLSAAAAAVAAIGLWKPKTSDEPPKRQATSATTAKESSGLGEGEEDAVWQYSSGTQIAPWGGHCLSTRETNLSLRQDSGAPKFSASPEDLLQQNSYGVPVSYAPEARLRESIKAMQPRSPGFPICSSRCTTSANDIAEKLVDGTSLEDLPATEKLGQLSFAEGQELLDQSVNWPTRLPSGSIRCREEEEVSVLVEDQWRLLAGSQGWEEVFTSVQQKAVLRYQRLWHVVQSLIRCKPATASEAPTEMKQNASNVTENISAWGVDRVVLLYAIPAFRREGGRNQKWKRCNVHCYVDTSQYTTASSSIEEGNGDGDRVADSTVPKGMCKTAAEGEWQVQEMVYVMEDPCNADSLFISTFKVPANKRLKCCFFTDADSDDADFPAQSPVGCDCQTGHGSRCNSVEWPSSELLAEPYSRFHDRRCYAFPPGALVTTIRDGEVADGDKITAMGITLRLDHELRQNEEWAGASLLYMVEHAGSWVEKCFSELDGSVTLTEQRSVTFVVKSRNGHNYLHANGGGNMRVAFPGAYIICPNGRVVECALTASAHTPTHQQHEVLVTQLMKHLEVNGFMPSAARTRGPFPTSPSERIHGETLNANETQQWRLIDRPQMFSIHTPPGSEFEA